MLSHESEKPQDNSEQAKSPLLLTTLGVHKTEFPCFQFTYLEYATELKDDGFSQIVCVPKTRAITVSSQQCSASFNKRDAENIKEMYGIDTESMLGSTLMNEANIQLEKQIFSKYKEIGETHELTRLNYRQKLILKYFKNTTFPEYVDESSKVESYTNKLVEIILNRSTSILKESRISPADFVIVSGKLAAILQDHPSFVSAPVNDQPCIGGNTYQIGTIAGRFRVIVNPMLAYNDTDNIMVIGKTTKSTDQGIHYAFYKNQFDTIETFDVEQKFIKRLLSRYSIFDAGNVQSNYYTVKIKMTKKPLWRRMLKV